jgi:hypothetical protein
MSSSSSSAMLSSLVVASSSSSSSSSMETSSPTFSSSSSDPHSSSSSSSSPSVAFVTQADLSDLKRGLAKVFEEVEEKMRRYVKQQMGAMKEYLDGVLLKSPPTTATTITPTQQS